MKNIPNLFIPAFGKCGTTTTGMLLAEHPGIELPDISNLPWGNKYPKEPAFFFDSAKERLPHCAQTYKGESQYRIDGTPYYYASDYILSDIQKYSPGSKVIILMRDPVERAISLWNHFKQYIEEVKPEENVWSLHNDFTFEQQIDFELQQGHSGLFRGSLYVNDVKNILNFFPRGNVHFAFMEDLGDDHQLFLNKIFNFLGLPHHQIDLESYNIRSRVFTPTSDGVKQLRSVFYQQIEELEAIIGRKVPSKWGEKTKYE